MTGSPVANFSFVGIFIAYQPYSLTVLYSGDFSSNSSIFGIIDENVQMNGVVNVTYTSRSFKQSSTPLSREILAFSY